MEIYLQQDGQQTGPYTEQQLQESIASGSLNQFNLAKHDGLSDWQPLCTIIHIATPAPSSSQLPTPASGTPHLPPAPSTTGTPHLNPPPPPPDLTSPSSPPLSPPSPSAAAGVLQSFDQRGVIIAGWACFVLGFIVLLVFPWPFYIHFALFVAAVILSIEALSQHKIISGLSLLLASLLLPTLVGFGLLFYQLNKDIESISDSPDKSQIETRQTADAATDE